MNWIKLDQNTTTDDFFRQLIVLEANCGLEPFSNEMLRECIAYLDTYAWLDGERIAGFITVQAATQKSGGGIYIVNLNVDAAYRRQGLGSSLMRTALAHYSHSHRGKPVILDVLKTNIAAQNLYQKLGFMLTDIPSENGPGDYVMLSNLDTLLGICKTQRLMLCPMLPENAETLSAILRSDVTKATYMVPDLDEQSGKQLALRIISLSIDRSRYVRGIYCGNELIGFLNDVETIDKSIELGWVIAPEKQNKGYCTEAVKTAIEDLFSRGYTNVIAGAFSQNKASIRVMEKAGMQPIEKTEEIEYRGQTHKCVYFERCKS